MKANITNLKKVLRICAKAHKASFYDWSQEGQFGIESDTPATFCDVQMVLQAFYGRDDMVEAGYGFVTVWLMESMDRNKRDVDLTLCRMALPHGTELN